MPATPSLASKAITGSDKITQSNTETSVSGIAFTQQYDKLVIAVGAYSQSELSKHLVWSKLNVFPSAFNIPGVKEHAHFLKNARYHNIRSFHRRSYWRFLLYAEMHAKSGCASWNASLLLSQKFHSTLRWCIGFEQANQPTISDVDRRNLLNFCIVGMSKFGVYFWTSSRYVTLGGGPTGVEFAAELHDLLHSDIERHYPALARIAKITLYDVAPKILGSFDESLVS